MTMISRLALLLLGAALPASSRAAAYGPLDCNAAIASSCASSSPFSTLVDSASTGGRVVVPCGECYHVDYADGETVQIGGLEVVGRLSFPPSSSVVLNATGVIVQGFLDIDPPADGNRVEVVLRGHEEHYYYPHEECGGQFDPGCSARRGVGKKPIVAAGGRLNIRGIDEGCPSWTRLDRKVSDTVLKVDAAFASCVKVGDEILVASESTSWKDDATRTVTSVDHAMGDITLDAPISRSLPALTGPGEPEFAVEVARMSRSVVFTAMSDDPEGEHIGGHMMVFETPAIQQVISGVRFDNFGQSGNIGRYPIHFHLCDDADGSIVSKNAITNSNQRCVLIHGTNGVTVEDNVAWNTNGHCYATETGSEINNVFSSNFGARTNLLWFHNGQSDSSNFWTGKHKAATFWVRNMNNEWVGNVAAGSESMGWWIEMSKLNGDQRSLGPVSSFRDNVAHSNKDSGIQTYKKGWKPANGGVLDGWRVYKHPNMGLKYHITGNVRVMNGLFADNNIHVLAGVWNDEVTFENTVFDGLSRDLQLRKGKTCPTHKAAAVKHAYNNDINDATLTFMDVTFKNMKCGKDMMQFHNDDRGSGRSMGSPVKMSGVSLVDVAEASKPHFNCDWQAHSTFLEDVDGVMGPSASNGPGFVVRNVPKMLAFIPPDSCVDMPYAGNGCSVFCESTCLRQVGIQPLFDGQTRTDIQLRLSDGVTEFTFSSSFDDVRIVLPKGSYHGTFLGATGAELLADSVQVMTYNEPLCTDFVTANDFTFPTKSPTSAPTKPPPVVRIKSVVNGRYLWVRSDGGLTASSDMTPLENTEIVLKEVDCLGEGYLFNNGPSTPCYLILWSHGRRLGSKSGATWKNGVYATSSSSIARDNYWFLDPIDCGDPGLPAGSCTLLRNAWNGRTLYDHDVNMVLGASPENPASYIYDAARYRWTLLDAESGEALDVTELV